jgi:hypothetical protein
MEFLCYCLSWTLFFLVFGFLVMAVLAAIFRND